MNGFFDDLSRWIRPLRSLSQHLWFKLLMGVWATFEGLFTAVTTKEIMVIALAMLVDTFSGVWAAWLKGEALRSRGFRQLLVKTIEYVLFLGLVVAAASTYEELLWMQRTAFIIVLVTEIWSTGENFQSIGIHHLMTTLRRMLKERNQVSLPGDQDEPTPPLEPAA